MGIETASDEAVRFPFSKGLPISPALVLESLTPAVAPIWAPSGAIAAILSCRRRPSSPVSGVPGAEIGAGAERGARRPPDERQKAGLRSVHNFQDIEQFAAALVAEIEAFVRHEHFAPISYPADYKGGREALEAQREAAKAPARPWIWEKAKSEYSAHLANNNRQATKTDYEKKLRLPELSRFVGRSLPSITANEIAKVYADIHSRSRSTGDAFRRVVKAFWSYLGDATRADETGVTIDLSRLKKIPDPRVVIGDPNTPFDPEKEHSDAPPEIELGRLLAISRCPGVPDPRIAYGVQLLLASAQRRRTVIGAARNRFKRYAESAGRRSMGRTLNSSRRARRRPIRFSVAMPASPGSSGRFEKKGPAR